MKVPRDYVFLGLSFIMAFVRFIFILVRQLPGFALAPKARSLVADRLDHPYFRQYSQLLRPPCNCPFLPVAGRSARSRMEDSNGKIP
jgi:hypothetical protein